MNKIIILVLIDITLVWSNAFSQTHFFSLSDQSIGLSKKSYNITKVTDERSDKSNIGWTQKGLGNVKVNASFINPTEKEVMNFLNTNLQSEGPKLQVIIRTLKISEKTGFSKESGFCELSLEFLLEDESQVYRVLQTSITTEVTGGDVTKKHPKNIATAFKMCFDQLEKVDLLNISDFQILLADGSSNEIPDSVRYDFPIFKEIIKTGIYASYEELKNNSPSNTETFVIEKKQRTHEPWTGTYEIVPKFEETSRKVKKVWGIAYEGQVYVYHQKEFFPLTIKDFELYFYGYGMPSNENISTGIFVGGLIGAGIASGIENTNTKKQKVKYFLDPNTGGRGETILEQDVK